LFFFIDKCEYVVPLVVKKINYLDFISQNDEWILSQIKNNPQDIYWQEIGLVWSQFQGLYDAYSSIASPNMQLTRVEMLMINMAGDMIDILPALIFDDIFAMQRKRRTHCSALVRFTSNDLFCGHNTWDSYQSMTRIFKRYTFPSSDPIVKSSQVLFSSYPATLSSVDDFYVTSSNLFVTETTNTNIDMILYELLTPKSVMSFARAIVANRLSSNAPDWVSVFSKYNSGTYNNQWIVVDHNLFTPGMTQLKPNTVWIAEQIPDYIESGDVTDVVNSQGYWGSFYVPYFTIIFDAMGYPISELIDSEASRNCSRALIFQRDAPQVQTLSDMKRIMQYNEWQTDEFSDKNPCHSIASRCDLSGNPFGAIDAKVTNHEMVLSVNALIINGPTHQEQVPFNWSISEWSSYVHYGQPEVFDFDWISTDF